MPHTRASGLAPTSRAGFDRQALHQGASCSSSDTDTCQQKLGFAKHDRLQLATTAYRHKQPIRHCPPKRAWDSTTARDATVPRSILNRTGPHSNVAQAECGCPSCHRTVPCGTRCKQSSKLDEEALKEQMEVLSVLQASTECWSPAGWLKAGPLLKSRTVHAQHGILHGQAAQRANAEVSLQLYPSLSLSLMKESSSTYGKKPDLTQQASGADFISDHQAQQYSPSKATACISPDPSADLAGCLQSVVCSTPDQAGNANLQPVPAEQLPLTKAKTCPFTATKACAANQSLQDSDIPGNRQQPSAHQLSYEHRSANTGSAGAAAVPEHARDISRATPEHLCCVQQNESELHIARTQSSGICATDGAAKAEETSHRPSRLLHQPQATQCTPAQQQQPACIRVSLPDGQTDRQRLHQAASCQQQLRAGQTAEGAVCNHQQQQGHSCDTPGTMPSLPQAQAPGMSQMGLAQETVAAAVKHQSQLPEQSAAAMAAWLLQQPELLQGVLDQLEAFAAQGTPADVSTSKSNCPIAQADCQNQDALAVRQMSVHEAWEQPNACSAVQQVNTTACAVEAALNAPNHAASQPCSSSDTAAVTDPSDRHHCSSPHNAAAVVEGLEGQLCSEADAGNLLGEADGVVGLDVICSKHGVQPMPANLTAQDSPAHQLLEHSRAGRYDDARQLVKQGIPVDGRDRTGNTALMLACQQGHGRLVKLLMRKGADVTLRNLQGLTAEQHAQASMHSNVVRYLQASKLSQAAEH